LYDVKISCTICREKL